MYSTTGYWVIVLGLTFGGTEYVQAHDFVAEEPIVLGETLTGTNGATLPEADVAALRSVIDQFKLWDAGQVLSVCFFNGSQEVRSFFVEISKLWDDAASINFDFGTGPDFRNCNASSHIRVSFTLGAGNWSLVGTDSIAVDATKPSLNVEVPANFALANKRKLGGTMLHELGHALAMKHEHQSPESNCSSELDWQTVNSALSGPPNNWDQAKIDRNMKQFVDMPRLIVTPYDPKSIMHYSLPVDWFIRRENSSCFVQRNDDLSPTDLAAIAQAYPATPQQQDRHIANLDVISAAAVSKMDLSNESRDYIQSQIDRALKAVEGRETESKFLNQVNSIQTSGECSPVLNATSGNITLNCTFGR
jgi:Astacin (Peptidase family M12A)